MTFEIEQTPTPSKLMHATINNLSTIISIAQFNLISEAMSPKLQEDLKRIIQTAREASNNLKALAEIIQEDE
jgi:hypothetical protein